MVCYYGCNTLLKRMNTFVLVAGMMLLSACATAPEEIKREPVFYPDLPNPPYIQHLHSITHVKDLGLASTIAEFVLGKDGNERLLQKPYGLATRPGKIYVVDTRGFGYVVIDLEQKTHTLINGSGSGRMKKPINITVDEQDNKYITDTDRKQVLLFDHKNEFVRAYGVKGQFKPADVVVVGDKLYISDLQNHLIQVLDKKSGRLLFKMAETKGNETAKEKSKPKPKVKLDKKSPSLYFPTNMKVHNNKLYISDTGYFKVVRYALDGKFIDSMGQVGTTLGSFARPKGIALDKQGRLYVVDAAFENIQLFNEKDQLLLFFGGPGGEPHNINLPTNIVIDYDNVKYFQQYAAPGFNLEYLIIVASQFGNNRVNVFGFGRMAGMEYPADK